jgi:hypothetical protein
MYLCTSRGTVVEELAEGGRIVFLSRIDLTTGLFSDA